MKEIFPLNSTVKWIDPHCARFGKEGVFLGARNSYDKTLACSKGKGKVLFDGNKTVSHVSLKDLELVKLPTTNNN